MSSFHFLLLVFGAIWVSCKKCPQLVSDISQESCISKSGNTDSFYYDLEEGSCLPKCKNYANERLKNCASDQKCMPGYVCDRRCGPDDDLKQIPCKSDDECVTATQNDLAKCGQYCVTEGKESCMAYYINVDDYRETYWSALRFKPTCNNDGTWSAKQCKGGLNGRCFCFDPSGNRLFGEALFSVAENMTCACSRRQAELNLVRTTTLHCDSVGNYESLQCDKLSKRCWCADPQTGELKSVVVSEKAVELLPCFSVKTYGTQYLRQCESKKFAQTMIKQKLTRHGVTHITEDFLLCDSDGSYGALTIDMNNAYCTWRNNSKIASWWENIQSGYEHLNCNCARDRLRHDSSQTCLNSGNYKPLQQNLRNYYCVDGDGFAKSDVLTDLTFTPDDSFCDQFF